jgi:hypothetical protein
MISEVQREIVLPRRPPKNYEVSLSPGGDCGACVVAGLLGKTVEEAYELHCTGNYYGGEKIPKIHHWTFDSMKDTLDNLQDKCNGKSRCARATPWLLDHAVTDIPIWPFGDTRHYLCFGMRAQSEWRDYAQAMLNGGYYGVAQVKMGGHNPDGPLKNGTTTDHWVLLCGWRYVYHREEGKECGHWTEEILVGDSARSQPLERWVDLNDFQNYWGGFQAMWAKPRNET